MNKIDRRDIGGDATTIVAMAALRAAELLPNDENDDLTDEGADELFDLVDAAAHLRPETIEDVGFLLLAAHHHVSTLQDSEAEAVRC